MAGILEQYSEAEIEKALQYYNKQKERQKRYRERQKERLQDPEVRKRIKEVQLRHRVRQKLLIEKAVAAGITVSDEEVERYIAEHYA